ncbi:hypothetical protein A374_18239 [Fictibacillus macauensis ZFHKF-1]|uniref:Uncharacterized protein n=1 Tax=Fictibacillus macauensis ZFHKF-1 TaxID=1196324 RepID=I8IX10_9BACL|nr:hypothetical protein A374_18239 [Fictibacillus macauensis ZFHKF-1]
MDLWNYRSKKNDYDELHDQIKEALETHKSLLKNVVEMRDTYFKRVPHLDNKGIPSIFVVSKIH